MYKRKHVRLSAMGVVEAVVQGQQPQEAYLASIGRGGLGIYLQREVKPPQLVLFSLKLVEPKEGEESLKVAARVRWAAPAGELFMAGLSFERMSDARYLRLLEHLNLIEHWQLGSRGAQPEGAGARFTVRE